jgi:hypothetical protein
MNRRIIGSIDLESPPTYRLILDHYDDERFSADSNELEFVRRERSIHVAVGREEVVAVDLAVPFVYRGCKSHAESLFRPGQAFGKADGNRV